MSVFSLADQARGLQFALHSVLTNDASLKLGLGDPVRAYDDSPPNPEYPYLTYGNIRSTDTSGDDAPQSTHQIDLNVWSRDAGRRDVFDLMRRVQSAVDRDLPHIIVPLYLDVLRAPDGRTFRGLLRLSITLTEGASS